MEARKILILAAATAIAYAGTCNLGHGGETSTAAMIDISIPFEDIAPADIVLEQCWNAMGMDAQERVYIGFTSKRPQGREDFAVFRYDPATRNRVFLGTFMNTSQAAGNLQAMEEIPKGHTRMLEIGGKMYMASQGFHDFKEAIDTLPNYRGAHLYAYDLGNEKFEDVSASLPGGVIIEHQGIIALSYLPGYDLLIGLAHPSSDVVLFDYRQNEVRRIVPGIPWRLGNPLSREIVATAKGKIYTYRGTEDASHRSEVNSVWSFDLNTSAMTRTPYTATGGFWNGQTWTRDGRTIYMSTVNGELYELDVEKEIFIHLGHFLPREAYKAGERVDSLYGITLSADEKRIYGIPRRSPSGGSDLYSYEIATAEIILVKKLEPAIYTGSHMRDSAGRIYFARFGDKESGLGKANLVILQPSRN
jgi:hypothetical protein